jgi:tetratricopeptide (TPR) repeat protein
MKAAREYAAAEKDPAPLKNAAGILAEYKEKGKARELYTLYFRAFSSQDMTDEQLYSSASGFVSEGNIELAESAFDSYAERAGKIGKEKQAAALLAAAKALAYRDNQANDPAYAEQMFAQAEAAGGAQIFDEETLHLRALNLQQSNEMAAAGPVFAKLAEHFPQGQYYAEAMFKAGVIAAYVNRDKQTAVADFEKIATSEPPDAYAVSALYQLGLLKQWEGDAAGAKELYTKCQEKAGEAFMETGALAAKRVEEIDSSKPMDFGTRVFLDNALGETAGQLTMTKANISSPGISKKGQEIEVSSTATPDPSGCTAVTLSYYWSGDLGGAAPGSEQSNFGATHRETGTKVVNLLVMSPNGALDRAVKFIDVK